MFWTSNLYCQTNVKSNLHVREYKFRKYKKDQKHKNLHYSINVYFFQKPKESIQTKLSGYVAFTMVLYNTYYVLLLPLDNNLCITVYIFPSWAVPKRM